LATFADAREAREARVSLLSRLALNEIPAGESSLVALRDAARRRLARA
jgi:hypothetical protein